MEINKIYNYNCLEGLKLLADSSVDCCVTSPPFWGLRDYGTATWVGGDESCKHYVCGDGGFPGEKQKTNSGSLRIAKDICPKCGAIRQDEQLGLEKTPEEYVANMVKVFSEVKRVLKKEGTLWLNLGDSYAGSGRGRNTDGTWNSGKGGSKQETNKGAITGRTVNAKSLSKKLIKEGAIGNAWVKPPRGYKPKDLVGIPWMTAFALRSDGWWLRQDIIWHKPNPMPESVTDRCTKSHEYIFLLSKSQKYYFNNEAIQEEALTDIKNIQGERGTQGYTVASGGITGNAQRSHSGGYGYSGHKNLQDRGQPSHSFHESRAEGIPDELYAVRNKRDVWTVNTKPYKEAHFAVYPEELIVNCIKAGCPPGGIVLDPFMGSGTTGVVARKLDRNFIGFELNPKYITIADKRLYEELGMFL